MSSAFITLALPLPQAPSLPAATFTTSSDATLIKIEALTAAVASLSKMFKITI